MFGCTVPKEEAEEVVESTEVTINENQNNIE
jgi:hypothetical protein